MKLTKTGSNQTVIQFDNGSEVLFSYQTPVAGFLPGTGYVRTSQSYSATTTRHINKYLGGANPTTLDQSEIDNLAGPGL